MPATNQDSTVYISTGDPEKFYAIATLYKPGELGKKFTAITGKKYQIVQVDSGASATYPNTVANGLVFWASRTQYTVVPTVGDALNVAQNGNGVAGRCPGVTAPGSYFAMQIGGSATVVFTSSTTNSAVGNFLYATASNTSSAGNGAASYTGITKVIGVITSAATTAAAVTASLCADDAEVG